jgi:hypothetical protein
MTGLDTTRAAIENAALVYWREAVEPFHQMGWQTGTFLLVVFLVVTLTITWIMRISHLVRKAKIAGAKIVAGPHTATGDIGLSFDDYIRAMADRPEALLASLPTQTAKRQWCVDTMRRERPRHFVVTIVDQQARNIVLYKELRVWAKAAALPPGQMQLDSDCLQEVRRTNAYPEDDLSGSELQGTYDVHIRRPRWYDIRHWLLHPNREIRIAIWVAIITTFVPLGIGAIFSG